METILKNKIDKRNSNFLQWLYTISINGNKIFNKASIRYSKTIGKNFIVVNEVECQFQDLFEEKAKPLFKSKGRITGFSKNPINRAVIITTDRNEFIEIEKEKNDLSE